MSAAILTDDYIETLFTQHDNEYAFAYAIEQAVLQSSEVQAWKRDAERLNWLADPNNSIGNVQLPTECVIENAHSLRAAIDAAMELS